MTDWIFLEAVYSTLKGECENRNKIEFYETLTVNQISVPTMSHQQQKNQH